MLLAPTLPIGLPSLIAISLSLPLLLRGHDSDYHGSYVLDLKFREETTPIIYSYSYSIEPLDHWRRAVGSTQIT